MIRYGFHAVAAICLIVALPLIVFGRGAQAFWPSDLFGATEDAPVIAASQGGAAPGDAGEEGRLERLPSGEGEIKLTFAPLVRETAPAVVNVYAARAVPQRLSPFANDPFFGRFFGAPSPSQPRIESSLGSGVIVDPSGLVVTNNHVIADADEVRIAFSDGREFETNVLLKDKSVDLAVLRIEGDGEIFPTVPLSDSDGLEIGDLVLAIGNPFGIGQTVTNGIVSALARTHLAPGDPGVFIQTDAAINPGNSGGALIDMHGELVGINSAIFSKSGGSNGIGFAIPSNLVRSFVQAAKAGGRFERPYIGASFAPVSADIAEAVGLDRPSGAIVQSVAPSSPAEEAGLEAGDIVMEAGGFAIASPDALGYRLATTGLGEAITLVILRDEQRETLSIDLIAPPEIPPRDEVLIDGRNPFAGALVWNLSPRTAEDLDLPLDRGGVVIADVRRGSFAARFGLRPRDIVVSVNGQAARTTDGLRNMLEENDSAYAFEIERGGRRFVRRVR